MRPSQEIMAFAHSSKDSKSGMQDTSTRIGQRSWVSNISTTIGMRRNKEEYAAQEEDLGVSSEEVSSVNKSIDNCGVCDGWRP